MTLTAVAHRAGVHHSAVRRYFRSHQDILLRLAAEVWTRWSQTVGDALRTQARATAPIVAGVLANALGADPLFCDLLANVPLHLEHDVDVERVAEFKHVSRAGVESMADAIENALPGIGPNGALDIVTAANALAATRGSSTRPRTRATRRKTDARHTVTPTRTDRTAAHERRSFDHGEVHHHHRHRQDPASRRLQRATQRDSECPALGVPVTGVHGLSNTADSAGRIDPTQFTTVYVDISCPSDD